MMLFFHFVMRFFILCKAVFFPIPSTSQTKPLVHYGPEHPESNARQRETTRQRPAYDDLQINDRVGSRNNAVEYRTSRRRRWSGETKKVRGKLREIKFLHL